MVLRLYCTTLIIFFTFFKTLTTDSRKSPRNVCTAGGGGAVFSAAWHDVTPNAAVFGDGEGKLQILDYFRIGLSVHMLQLYNS